MSSTFARAVNDYRTTTPGHAAGAATLALATGTGAGLGTLPAGRIFRVTALSGPGTTSEAILGVFEATGISGDTLTGVAGAEGFGNVALPAGATVEVRMTAQDYEDHSAAINAAEATIADLVALAPPAGSLTAPQIQALIDARAGTGKAVVLPAGTHYLDRPLRISQPLTTLLGDPGGGTVLTSMLAGGMPTIRIGPVLSPAPVLFDGQMSRWVNLRDTRSGDIDGLATLTIRFDFDLAALPPADESQVILSSGGARKEFGEYTESLRIDIFNGNLRGKFTTATGQVALATPIAVGPHLIELIYDGSTVALRVDGSGPSVAATGPVSQGFYEDFVLGSCLARWPDGLCFFYPAVGTMTNFFMDGPGPGNPLFQIPSFATADQLIPCETRYGQAMLLLKKDGDGSASIQHCRVADLQVVANHGHGVFMTQTQASILERLQLTGRQPLTMWNNAYVDSVRDLHCYGWSVGARYGMAMIGGTCNEARNINVSLSGPGVGIVAVAASSNFDRCYVIGGQMKLGLLCKATGSGRWSNSIVTDEDQSVPGEAALLFSGVDAVLVDGGGSYALGSPHPVVILDNCKATTFVGHQLGATATTPGLFSVAACGPVAVESCPVVPAGVPYGAGVTIVPGSVAIGDAVSGGTAGRVLFAGAGPALADDDDLTWDAPARALTVGATQAGLVKLGPLPGFPTFGGVWIAQATPSTINYAISGGGPDVFFNGPGTIQFRIGNNTRIFTQDYRTTFGFNVSASDGDPTATVTSMAAGATYAALALDGVSGQTSPLARLRGVSSTGTARDLGYVDAGFAVATDASFTGYIDVDANDFAGRRKGLRVASDGTQALVGAFGATPVARPSGDVAAGLAALGWMTSPAYAASGLTGTVDAARMPALTGDVTTTAGSVATTIGTGKVTNAMLAGSIASSKLVGTDIATVGTVTAGTWNATAIAVAGGGTGATDAATARANLGLGSAATHPDTDFLTPTGNGSGLTALNASALASGTVPTARLPAVGGRLAATVTTTSSTLGTNALTGLGFAIGASEVWTCEWNLTVTGSTAGMKFDVTGPASPTDLRISVIGNTSAITAISAETITAFSTASAAYVLYATTSGQVRIVASINNGANAGTVQLRFGAVTGAQSNSVLLNSYMNARRIG
jgi:hypothetical protein